MTRISAASAFGHVKTGAETSRIARTHASRKATPPKRIALGPNASVTTMKVAPPATSAIGSARRGAGSA